MIDKIAANNALSVLIFAGIFVLISILLLNYVFAPTMDKYEWREEVHRVQAGDTLWALSGEYCPDNVDRREWIEEIRALNNLHKGTIYAGQSIIVLTPTK